jgi:hypothetical protein
MISRDMLAGRRLLAGSPKPDRSKGRRQTKCNPLVLQFGGWAWCKHLHPLKSFLIQNLTEAARVPKELYSHGRGGGGMYRAMNTVTQYKVTEL